MPKVKTITLVNNQDGNHKKIRVKVVVPTNPTPGPPEKGAAGMNKIKLAGKKRVKII